MKPDHKEAMITAEAYCKFNNLSACYLDVVARLANYQGIEKINIELTDRLAHTDASGDCIRKETTMNELVKSLVNRFLQWKLPKEFHPDAGISFKPAKPYEGDELGNSWWPTGTNLFSADQATEMVEYMLQDIAYLQVSSAEVAAYAAGAASREKK